MKTGKQKDFSNFFDQGPEEPDLSTLSGYDCCGECYFKSSTLERITDGVKQIHGRGT